ncbi:unnamed protein product [Strongylus vulgaris]|uniref:Cytidyltransferase-like domain-containing protein n=1 Tax=Strongylus vulgaris TaxID=40348 RepID=A0A3P7IYE4_STRVU|nr:unnamed protein product [Strongylus vulgaris]
MATDPCSSISGCRVALLSCGQFDPPSYAHLRMFERARDFLMRTMGCKVVEGIMSVAGDTASTRTPAKHRLRMVETANAQEIFSCEQWAAKWSRLADFSLSQSPLTITFIMGIMSVAGDTPSTRTPAKHRLRMVETAVRKNFWIRAGNYECNQQTPVRQLAVLKHYQKKISQKHDEPIRMIYICGSEVLDELLAVQADGCCLWTHAEIKELLQKNGLIVLKRGRTHPSQTIYLTDVLRQYQKNIYVIEDETFPNDLRCSRIRTAIRRGESVKYCLDDDVIEYIHDHNLYQTSTRSQDDDKTVPPEPPQRSSSEGLSDKYKHVVSSEEVIYL